MGVTCSSQTPFAYEDNQPPTPARLSNGSRKKSREKSIFSSSSYSSEENSLSKRSSSSHRRRSSLSPQDQECQGAEESGSTMHLEQNIKTRPIPVDPKVPGLADLPANFMKILCGRQPAYIPHMNKLIHIYHCANYTDSIMERTVLHDYVYPEVRDYCIRNGCDLMVTDLQLGIKDEFAGGHCQRGLSQKILSELSSEENNAVLTIFLNEKYGIYWCPLTIDVDSFNDIMKKVTEEDKHFLMQWYSYEEDRIEPQYVLCPVEQYIPRYKCQNDSYKDGYREWEKHLIRLRNIISQTSSDFQKQFCKSGIEEQLEEFVFSEKWSKDNIIWLRRTFTNFDFEPSNSSLANYVDVTGNHINEVAQGRLRNLTNRLIGKIIPKNKIELEIDWQKMDTQSQNTTQSPYILKMCDMYKSVLMETVDGLLSKIQKQDILYKKIVHKAISSNLYHDVLQHAEMSKNLSEEFTGQSTVLDTLENYIQMGSIDSQSEKCLKPRPLVLHGVSGSRKSTLAAKIAASCSSIDGWTGSVCAIRFIGASTYCASLDQLLLSIREQLCVLSGLPIHLAHKDDATSLDLLLGKVPLSVPLVLIIDGLDKLSGGDSDMNWLPEILPQHIRLILTVTSHSPALANLKIHLSTESDYLEIPTISTDESVCYLEKCFSDHNLGIPKELEAELDSTTDRTYLKLVLLSILLTHKSKSNENWNSLLQQDTAGLVNCIFDILEDQFTHETIGRVCAYISSSRFGVSGAELVDLLQNDPNVCGDILISTKIKIERKSSFIWMYLKDFLHPVLLVRKHHGSDLYKWKFSIFEKVAKERYQQLYTPCVSKVIEYYDNTCTGSTTNKGKKSSAVTIVKKNLSKRPQNLQEGKFFNVRKLDELLWHLIIQKTTGRFCTEALFNWDWLNARIQSGGYSQLLQDMALGFEAVPAESTQACSLIAFISILQEMRSILLQDSTQLKTQLHFRLKSSDLEIPKGASELQKLLKSCQKLSIPLLAPVGENTLMKHVYKIKENVVHLKELYRIKDDQDHIISVAPDKGELKVWNVSTCKVIRTFTGMNQPKAVKMCGGCTAVVLCNRELKVYNLDNGTYISTLKGVLNIKMPYYGIHDEEHTIAMARNGMYVNMMSNSTGEMVITFKVGEDRFLDSLLTSENGSKCVCGDAVQKPFPLLVWDLHKRKLIYDLRIQGHEFLTKISAISSDGHYVVCACKELEDPDPTFLAVYDLQSGSLFKKWKEVYGVTGVAIFSSSKMSSVVSAYEDGTVCVYDLISGVLKFSLSGHCRGPDVIKMSAKGTRGVSYDTSGRDNTVRMWDFEKGVCLGTFYPGSNVSCCDISLDGSTVLVGLPGLEDIYTLAPSDFQTKKNKGVFGDASNNGKTFDVSESS